MHPRIEFKYMSFSRGSKEFRKLFLFSGKYHRKEPFKIAIDLFYSGNYDNLIAPLEVEASREVLKYFKNNRLEIINQGAEWNIRVSVESDVSILVKSPLGYGSIYSLTV